MKNIIALCIILILLAFVPFTKKVEKSYAKVANKKILKSVRPPESNEVIKQDWKYFVEALIFIESRGIDTIVNDKSGATGCLQIMPVYVKGVNKIIKERKLKDSLFTLSDRTSRVKSLRMFKIMQDYYNPKQDIGRAIFLHNSRAPISYKNSILKKMKEIKNKKNEKNI